MQLTRHANTSLERVDWEEEESKRPVFERLGEPRKIRTLTINRNHIKIKSPNFVFYFSGHVRIMVAIVSRFAAHTPGLSG